MSSYRIIYKMDRDAYLKLLTEGIPTEMYGRTDPIPVPKTGGLAREVSSRYQNVVWRRLKPMKAKEVSYRDMMSKTHHHTLDNYKHLIVEIPTPQGTYIVMRNGSNSGTYNFAIIHKGKYHWAQNVNIALDYIDLAITAKKDLPLLIGRMKSDKTLKMLEIRLREE